MLLITSHFILWLLQTSCSIFIDVACYNHSRVFYACCTISMHITVILVVMLKSAILLPKNSMCPILPLNKNYLRNYLEPKNYLEVPEWQDDSWSGNCSFTSTVVYFQGTSDLVPGYQVPLKNCKPPLRPLLNCKPPLNGVNARFELILQDTLFIVTNELFRFI